MGSGSLPSPPAEDHKSTLSRKSTSSSTKSVKPVHRTSKRASSNAAAIHHHDHVTHTTGMDGRHKRVWKACERCRMKKTKARSPRTPVPLSTNTVIKCDGEFPCKRCKDDGLVCTAGVRKKMEYKQLPRGYVVSRKGKSSNQYGGHVTYTKIQTVTPRFSRTHSSL